MPSKHPGSLDIVIVNWNAGSLLAACVRSVLDSDLTGVKLERLVVVDNASTDGSADFLAALPPPVRFLRNDFNRGFAAACNQGAAGSEADYLLFLNPDMVLDKDSLAGAVAFMDSHPEIGISGIRLRDEAGVTQRSCARFPTPGLMIAHMLGLEKLPGGFIPGHFLTEWDHEDSRAVEQVIGAFLLIRRAAFAGLNGFDERFFVYYEDLDLCYRHALAGGRAMHNAGVGAVHIGGGTTRAIKARRQFYAARSRILYAGKHFGKAAAVLVGLAALILEPLARMAQALLRGGFKECGQVLRGAGLLWGDLPELLCRRRSEPGRRSVLALTRYSRLGASSRTRFYAYRPALEAAGMDLTLAPFFDDGYLEGFYAGKRPRLLKMAGHYLRRLGFLLRARSYDLVWLEKEALPWLPFGLEGFLLGGVPLIVDFDDAWFRRYEAHPSALVRRLLGGKFARLVRLAATTIVGNAYLGDWARAAGAKSIVELPTAVDLDSYRPADQENQPPCRIGWMGTPTSARDYLVPLAPVLAQAAAGGRARLVVSGARSVALGVEAERLEWSEEGEIAQLQSFDIGIMPLLDDPWSRGKCAYKLIQYMAVGLPVVASPVGMNKEVVRPGENGFLAETPEEWLDALSRLAADPDLRRRMGEAGRRRVEEKYSVAVVGPRLLSAFWAALRK